MTADFPNLFTVTGPGSPSVLTNMIPTIEQHVEWITDCIDYVIKNEYAAMQPTVEAEDEWEARHKANLMPLEVNASAENTETLLELNEFDQPRVYEIKE